MLRKAIYVILALVTCLLALGVIDGLRHMVAIERLEKIALLTNWQYRIPGMTSPVRYSDAPAETWRAYVRDAMATPRVVALSPFNPGQDVVVDCSVWRDLAMLRVEDVQITNCRGLSPENVADFPVIPSIKDFDVRNTDLTNEALNRLWSRIPNVEDVLLNQSGIGVDAFRNVKDARKLNQLSVESLEMTNEAIAQLRDLPDLRWLELTHAIITEASAPLLAGMPALRHLELRYSNTSAEVPDRIRALNPKLVVEVVR